MIGKCQDLDTSESRRPGCTATQFEQFLILVMHQLMYSSTLYHCIMLWLYCNTQCYINLQCHWYLAICHWPGHEEYCRLDNICTTLDRILGTNLHIKKWCTHRQIHRQKKTTWFKYLHKCVFKWQTKARRLGTCGIFVDLSR